MPIASRPTPAIAAGSTSRRSNRAPCSAGNIAPGPRCTWAGGKEGRTSSHATADARCPAASTACSRGTRRTRSWSRWHTGSTGSLAAKRRPRKVQGSIPSWIRPREGNEMSGRTLPVSLGLALTALGGISARLPAPAPGPIVITDVTIVDPSGAHDFPRPVTVVVEAGHIVSVGPTPPTSARHGAQVIAGRGRFLIPGLWDMHVHVVDAGGGALGEAVAAGVTGIRDLGGELPVLDAWRREIAAGEGGGPLIVRAGPVLDGTNPGAPHRVTVLDSARAVFVVDSLAALGVDCIKVHAALPRAAFFATVAEARRRGLPVAAHLPKAVTAAEASDAGAASLEHVAETLLGSAINDPRHPAKTMGEAIAAKRGARARRGPRLPDRDHRPHARGRRPPAHRDRLHEQRQRRRAACGHPRRARLLPSPPTHADRGAGVRDQRSREFPRHGRLPGRDRAGDARGSRPARRRPPARHSQRAEDRRRDGGRG